MNPIAQGLALGYSGEQLLKFLEKIIPALVPKIHTAKRSGFKPEQILDFISKTIEGESTPKNMTPNEIHAARARQQEKVTKGLIGTAATAFGTGLGAYALQRAAPQAAQAITPQVLPDLQQQGQLPPQQKLGLPAPSIQAASQTPVSPQQPQAPIPTPQATQPSPQPVVKSPVEIINESGFATIIANLRDKNPPDVIATAIKAQTPQKIIKLFEKEVQKPLEQIVKEYIDATPTPAQQQQTPTTPIEQPVPTMQQAPNEIETLQQPTEEPMTVGSLALLPKGDIGEIQSVKNGIAKINVDGNEKHRKLDELIPAPISQPDLADLYAQLTQAIPEELRSSVINFAGYDSNANELAFRPHGGALYVYKDIPQEFADQLKNQMFQAKTTGENFYGAWSSGEGSYFSGLSKLIRDLQKQYGGRGKEYVRKYETLVDFLGAPEAAKKEKQKKEVLARREQKKAEKPKPKKNEKRKPKKPKLS